MSDQEYRELLRRYHSGDVILDEHLIRIGIRNSFSLLRMQQDGLPWVEVKKHLNLINQNILAPDEVKLYKEMVLQTTNWHSDFVNRPEFFVPGAAESWGGSWPGNMLSMSIYFTRFDYPDTTGMSPRKIRKKKLDTAERQWTHFSGDQWGTGVRIAFWGSDDGGMERDLVTQNHSRTIQISTDYPESIVILDDILRRLPNPLTQRWLRDNGFTNA